MVYKTTSEGPLKRPIYGGASILENVIVQYYRSHACFPLQGDRDMIFSGSDLE